MHGFLLAQARVDLVNKPTALNLFAGALVILMFAVAGLGYLGYRRHTGAGRLEKGGLFFAFLVWGTVAFQVVHTVEHVLQAGFWVRKPHYNPWLSPWALAAQKGLATYLDPQARPQTGNEVLHLLGNGIFLFGLLGIWSALKRAGVQKRDRRFAFSALLVEGIHMGEHVLLTSTWYAMGVPRGLSTLFGLTLRFEGPWAPGFRIVWHFLANLIPMILAIGALLELKRADLLSEKGFQRAMTLGASVRAQPSRA